MDIDHLRAWASPRLLASLLAAMQLGIICPSPSPKYGATRSRGTLPLFVRGREVPHLSDVEVAEYLGLRDHTLPDELRDHTLPDELLRRLDRVGEGNLALFRRLSGVVWGIRSTVERTVMGASAFPGSEGALTPLASLGKAARGYLIQAILVDLDPNSVLDERRPIDKRPFCLTPRGCFVSPRRRCSPDWPRTGPSPHISMARRTRQLSLTSLRMMWSRSARRLGRRWSAQHPPRRDEGRHRSPQRPDGPVRDPRAGLRSSGHHGGY